MKKVLVIPCGALIITLANCSSDQSGFSGGATASRENRDKQSGEALDSLARDQDFGTGSRADDPYSEIIGSADLDIKAVQDVADVLVICENSQLSMQSDLVVFEPTSNCQFGVGENLTARSFVIRAQNTQRVEVKLPENAIICGIEFNSIESDILYDDAMALKIGPYQMMSSIDNTAELQMDSGLPLYDWQKMLNKPFDVRGSDIFCVGDCSLPGHDESGSFDLSIDSEVAAPIALKMKNEGSLAFELVTMGDDDPGDCEHTGVSLEAKIHFFATAP